MTPDRVRLHLLDTVTDATGRTGVVVQPVKLDFLKREALAVAWEGSVEPISALRSEVTFVARAQRAPLPVCDCCDRRRACVSRVHSSYAGDTDACCKCRNAADADGHCDDCR